MIGSARGIVVGAWIAACGHAESLVIDEPEGPAPGRVARAEDLRRDLRAQARELRRQPSQPFHLLPSGLPEIQRSHPERDELVDRARVRGDEVYDRGIVELEPRGDGVGERRRLGLALSR